MNDTDFSAQPGQRRMPSPGRRALPALLLSLAASACAGGAGMPGPQAPSPAPDAEARGVPGFDTREYPGDGVMTRWLEESPYRWVGYYLPAPCHTGTSWQGKRSTLRSMGWGLAVLFVGEQDWPASADHPATDTAAAGAAGGVGAAGERCTRTNLSETRGREDGREAARAARAEGFGSGAVVYLDVERVDTVSARLGEYVEGWTAGLSEAGYRPGLYAHARNAAALLTRMREAAAGGEIRLWVASTGGFSLRRAPSESGFPATIWQGVLDVEERWGGTTLRIDRNVADQSHPSG